MNAFIRKMFPSVGARLKRVPKHSLDIRLNYMSSRQDLSLIVLIFSTNIPSPKGLQFPSSSFGLLSFSISGIGHRASCPMPTSLASQSHLLTPGFCLRAQTKGLCYCLLFRLPSPVQIIKHFQKALARAIAFHFCLRSSVFCPF